MSKQAVIKDLEICCNALNHEDEDFIPAIQYAIAVLKGQEPEPYEPLED